MSGFLKGLLGKFSDDKGMFQGGAEGRVGGRTRDYLESKPTDSATGWRDESMRDMAKTFDVNDNESVLKLQQWMNYKNQDSDDFQPLAEDGMFGKKSLAALRRIQGIESVANNDSEEPAQSPIDPDKNPGHLWNSDAGGAPGPWADYLFKDKRSSSSNESSSIKDDYSKNSNY